jgi:hypothetical protein
MNWKEMRRKWPTAEVYAKDHTAFEVATGRWAFFAALAAAACLAGAAFGLVPWSWFLWAAAGAVALLAASTVSIAWRKVR